jgi:hypothetical protein
MRAYLRSTPPLEGVNDTVLDTSRPVLIEDINALGWRVFTPGATIQGQENFKTLASRMDHVKVRRRVSTNDLEEPCLMSCISAIQSVRRSSVTPKVSSVIQISVFLCRSNELTTSRLTSTLCVSGLLVMVLSGSYLIDIEGKTPSPSSPSR